MNIPKTSSSSNMKTHTCETCPSLEEEGAKSSEWLGPKKQGQITLVPQKPTTMGKAPFLRMIDPTSDNVVFNVLMPRRLIPSINNIQQRKVKQLNRSAVNHSKPIHSRMSSSLLLDESDVLLSSDSHLFQLATNSRVESLSLQALVDICSEKTFARISKFALKSFFDLVIHPSGTYLLQRLASRSEVFSNQLIPKFSYYFADLAARQDASRTMSFLSQEKSAFRRLVIHKLLHSPEECISTNPGVFVAVSTVESCSEQDRLDLAQSIKYHKDAWLMKRVSRRVVLTLIETGDSKTLEELFQTLSEYLSFKSVVNQYTSAHILAAFLDRGYSPAQNLLTNYLKDNPLEMIHSPIFTVLIARHEERSPAIKPFKQMILKLLTSISKAEYHMLAANAFNYSTYSSIVACLAAKQVQQANLD